MIERRPLKQKEKTSKLDKKILKPKEIKQKSKIPEVIKEEEGEDTEREKEITDKPLITIVQPQIQIQPDMEIVQSSFEIKNYGDSSNKLLKLILPMKILKSLPEKEKSELPKLIKSLIDNDDRKNTLRKYFYIYRRNILEPLKPSDDKKKIEQKPSKEEDIIKTDKKEVKPEIQEKPKIERKDKTPEKQEEKEIIEWWRKK